jgi:hypothetical protein
MDLPNHKPTDPNVQRVELKVSDTKYLTVVIRPDDKHGQEISLSLFIQENDDLDLLACVNVYPDGEVFTVLEMKEMNYKQAAKLAEINNNWPVARWKMDSTGTLTVTCDDDDRIEIYEDGTMSEWHPSPERTLYSQD